MAKFSSYSVEKIVQMILHCDKEVLDNGNVMDFLQREDLCTIPEKGFEGYCALGLGIEEAKSTRIGRNGAGLFTSFGTDLFAAAVSEALAVYKSLRCPWEDIRMVFPHAASKRTYEEHASLVGSPSFYFVYPNYGNIVSASVPAGIDLARKENQIKRGDRLVGLVSSAGMSFSAYSFIY